MTRTIRDRVYLARNVDLLSITFHSCFPGGIPRQFPFYDEGYSMSKLAIVRPTENLKPGFSSKNVFKNSFIRDIVDGA